MKTNPAGVLIALCGAITTGTSAYAFPIAAPGTEGLSVIVTNSSPIVATYQGNSATYSNDLYLMLDAFGVPADDGDLTNDLFIFNNHSSPVGSTVNLGSFAIGTELIFRLHVNNTGNDFYTGSGSRNPDGAAHARVEGNWQPGETLVSFEDLFNGPFIYNDLSFSFTNTGSVICPDSMAHVATSYSSALVPVDMTPPYTFSIVGILPTGLALDTSTGAISGTPITAGLVNFTVEVVDAISRSATSDCSITVHALCELRSDCRVAKKSVLVMKDNPSNDAKDVLVWKWIKGEPTNQAEFGDPIHSAEYRLCLYAGSAAAFLADLSVPADAAKWNEINGKGYKYKDKAGTASGIRKIVLKGNPTKNKSKVIARGKGTGLPDLDLQSLELPITAQLVNTDTNVCFKAIYGLGDVKKQKAKKFKAVAK